MNDKIESGYIYINKYKSLSPYLIFAGIIYYSIYIGGPYYLFAIFTFIAGWLGAAPNFNLANGCLPQLTLIFCLLLSIAFGPIAVHIGLVGWATWAIFSLELCISVNVKSTTKANL